MDCLLHFFNKPKEGLFFASFTQPWYGENSYGVNLVWDAMGLVGQRASPRSEGLCVKNPLS